MRYCRCPITISARNDRGIRPAVGALSSVAKLHLGGTLSNHRNPDRYPDIPCCAFQPPELSRGSGALVEDRRDCSQ